MRTSVLQRSARRFPLALCLLAGAGTITTAQPEFIPLGSPYGEPGVAPGGCVLSGYRNGLYGVRISADGQVVAGITYVNVQSTGALPQQVFRWTRATGSEVITPVQEIIYNGVVGLSADGSTIYGSEWRWTESGGFESLRAEFTPTPLDFGYIFGVSDDASVVTGITGSFLNFFNLSGYRWPINSGPREPLATVPEFPSGSFLFNNISGDGLVVGGSVTDRSLDSNGLPGIARYAAAVWLPGETIIIDTFAEESFVHDLSFDGSVAVGRVKYPGQAARPFRWTQNTGLELLPDIFGFDDAAEARAVSADGSIIVGTRTLFGLPDTRALYFDDARGTVDFEELLITEFGLGDQILGWQLVSLWDISADGSAIVGTGINPDGCTEAFLVRLGNSTCTGDIADDFGSLSSDGQVSFGDFLALLGLIGPCSGAPGCTGDIADDFGTLGADGQVSFGDFLALLGLIGSCES